MIKHAKVSGKSDGGDASQVQPSDWNASHVIDAGVATIDFGAFPGASDASVAVTGQTGIQAGSVVEAWLRLAATADHSADEHLVETIAVKAGNIVAGTGFTIYALNTNQIAEPGASPFASNRAGPVGRQRHDCGGKGTRLYGTWSVQWRWV